MAGTRQAAGARVPCRAIIAKLSGEIYLIAKAVGA
jgi:hypothetical protein